MAFKVRIVHFAQDKYTVQYCDYYFIPFWWKALMYFFEPSNVYSGLDNWSEKLFSISDAEEIANSIKSINDVQNFHKKWEDKAASFYARKEELIKRQVPFTGTKYL